MVVRMIFRPALEPHSNATFQSLSYRQQSTMEKPFKPIPSPLYKEDPFHLRLFRTPIVNGTYFEFLNQDRKRAVARIFKATKTDVGWLVDANLFINFTRDIMAGA